MVADLAGQKRKGHVEAVVAGDGKGLRPRGYRCLVQTFKALGLFFGDERLVVIEEQSLGNIGHAVEILLIVERGVDHAAVGLGIVRKHLVDQRLVGDGLGVLRRGEFAYVVMRDGVDICRRRGVVGDGAGDRAGVHALDLDGIAEIRVRGEIAVAGLAVKLDGFLADPDADHAVVLDLGGLLAAAAGQKRDKQGEYEQKYQFLFHDLTLLGTI